MKMDKICDEMIMNWDQTMSQFYLGLWKKKVPRRAELIRKDDKRQITMTFAGSINGNLLPL